MISFDSPLANLANLYSLGTSRQGQQADPGRSTSAGGAGSADKLLEALARRIPGMDTRDLKALDPDEFSPEKVAGRIADAVAGGLDRAKAEGRSSAELQSLYDSAMAGVEKGFREARDTLEGLKMLQGRVAERVDETERLAMDALAELAPAASGASDRAAGAGRMTSLSAAERYQLADSFELSLKTRDGDTVTLSFDRSADYASRFDVASDGNGNQVSQFAMSQTEVTGYSLSVQGNLDEDEMAALGDLFDDVDQLIADFYSGDMQKAFEQASDLSFDGSQLASMDLSMQRSETYSMAQRYQETQALARPSAEGHAGRLVGQFMREMNDAFSQPALQFMEDARQGAGQMMKALAEQDVRFKEAPADQQARFGDQMSRLLQALSAAPMEQTA